MYTEGATSTAVRLAGGPQRLVARGFSSFVLDTVWRRTSCVRAMQVWSCFTRLAPARGEINPVAVDESVRWTIWSCSTQLAERSI